MIPENEPYEEFDEFEQQQAPVIRPLDYDDIVDAYDKQKDLHLKASVAIDVVGMLSYSFSGVIDVFLFAPFSAIAIYSMYKVRRASATFGSFGGFVEEALPYTDIIPSATLMWVYSYQLRGEDTLKRFTKVKHKEHEIIRKRLDPNYKPPPPYGKIAFFSLFMLLIGTGYLYFFQYSTLFPPSDKSSLVREGLKDYVEHVSSTNYLPVEKFGEWAAGNPVDGSTYPTKEETDYDESGRETKMIASSGNNRNIIIRSGYDDKDDEFLNTSRSVVIDNQRHDVTKYHWGEGDTLKFDNYNPDGELLRTGFDLKTSSTRNDTTFIESETHSFLADGTAELVRNIKTLYNAEGDKISVETKTTASEKTTSFVTRYECKERDDKGNCTKMLVYDGKDSTTPKYVQIRSYTYH